MATVTTQLPYSAYIYTALHCLPSFRQMNTSGLVQVSDSDNDDLTKLVATLQSVVDSECE